MLNKISLFSLFALTLLFCFCFSSISFGAPFFQDSFESGDLLHNENGAHWYASTNTSVSKVLSHSGSYSLKYHFAAGATGTDTTAEQRFYFGTGKSEVYIRYYIYLPSGFTLRNTGTGPNNKMIRLWGGGDAGYNEAGKMGASFYGPTSGSNIATLVPEAYFKWSGSNQVLDYIGSAMGDISPLEGNYQITTSNVGKWSCWEWHFRKDNGSGNGAIEFWVDGVKMFGKTNLSYADIPATLTPFDSGYILGWANTGFSADTDVYIDDVVMSDSYIGPISSASSPPPAPTNLAAK